MDLLLIRLEKIDNDFYESLIKFISDHGYSPKVVVRNTDILSFHGLEIISSKHQVLLHDKEIKMTKKEFYILYSICIWWEQKPVLSVVRRISSSM